MIIKRVDLIQMESITTILLVYSKIYMSLVVPNTRWVVQKFQQMPIQDYQRKRTDIFCTVISFLLVATLFTWALFSFNREHIYKANFPADTQGNLCGVDFPDHRFIYFPNLDDLTTRYCVRNCPENGEKIETIPGVKLPADLKTYSTEAQITRMGKFCYPTNTRARQSLVSNSQLFNRRGFLNSWDSIRFCSILGVVIGLVYLILVQLCPQVMNWVGIVGGGVASIALGIVILIYKSIYFDGMNTGRIILAVFLILIGLYLLASACLKQRQIRLNGVFLDHASRMVTINWAIVFFIPFFLLLILGLITLTVFELFSFWSLKSPSFNPVDLFWQAQGGLLSVFLSLFLAFQFYWGLSFIKEAFNFIISGSAVNYYFRLDANCCQPFNRLVNYHWGSVCAGSFMTGLFALPDAIFDFFQPNNIHSAYAKCYTNCCFWLYGFFDLVRSDAMAYIHLTGLPYCNSSRYCEFLSTNSPVFGGHQSISRIYRFGSHMLLTSVVSIAGLFYTGNVSFWSVVFTFVLTYFITTFFASLHADAADALCITFLAEEYLEPGGYQHVVNAPPGLTFDITNALAYQ